MGRLTCDTIDLTYPGAGSAVVRDLSLDIQDGLITTIIGPNGCGKSTLLRALGRMMTPARGAVVLDGEMIQRLPTKEVARRLGLLHQQIRPPDGISVEDLVRRGRYPHQGLMQPPTDHDVAAVDRAIALAGMTELRARHVDSLSGGQRQRAWIAMTLAQETDLLLLDEPTTFLDVAHEIEILDLVRRLNADGRTVLMVLHDINNAARVSHRVVAMKDGRILREGTPAEVVQPALLAELYGVECDVLTHPEQGYPMCVPVSAHPAVGARSTPPAPSGSGVTVRNLGTGYGPAARVSRNLSTDLPAAAITSIVGPNACGKSTLLRTGGRLLKALEGSFSIGGTDSTSGRRRALARRLAMVAQGSHPPAGFLVEDIVAAGRLPHQQVLRQWSRRDAATVASALDRCGLTDLRYREIDTLSGGQRQRVWIAMALAQDTPFLFLDEPTTFLDIGYQIEVLDLVLRLNRDEGRTVVMVLHDLNLAARYSDHILAMKDGEIIASGHPDDVVDADLVRRVFSINSHVVTDERTGRPLVLPIATHHTRPYTRSPQPRTREPGGPDLTAAAPGTARRAGR